MNGISRTFWAAVGAFALWRAKSSNDRSTWWAKIAVEANRRSLGEAEARR